MTTDRLEEIKARWPEESWNTPISGSRADIAWLIQEVERLRSGTDELVTCEMCRVGKLTPFGGAYLCNNVDCQVRAYKKP